MQELTEERELLLEEQHQTEPLIGYAGRRRSTLDKIKGHLSTACCCSMKRFAPAFGVLGLILFIRYVLLFPIVSHVLNSTQMSMASIRLTNPNGTFSVDLESVMSIENAPVIPVTLLPWNATISYNNVPVGTFLVPKLDLHHSIKRYKIPPSTLYISNITSWNNFAVDMVSKPNLSWQLSGNDITISTAFFKLSGLTLLNAMTLSGMSGLQQMNIIDMDMSSSTESAVKLQVAVCIYNPSVTAMEPIGSLCLNGAFRNSLVTTLHTQHEAASLPITATDESAPECRDTSGKLGYNILKFTGKLLPVTKSSSTKDIVNRFVTGQSTDLQVSGCRTDEPATNVKLYAAAMSSLNVSSTIRGIDTPLVQNLYFKDLKLLPQQESGVGMKISSNVEAYSPLGEHSSLLITQISMNLTLLNKSQSVLGTLQVPRRDVNIHTGRIVGRKSNISIEIGNQTSLKFPKKSSAAFTDFVKSAVVSKNVEMDIIGNCSVVAYSHALNGTLTLSPLPINLSSMFPGMSNLSNVTIKDFNLSDFKARDQGVSLVAHAVIDNPSKFSVPLSKVQLQMSLGDNVPIGNLLATSMDLSPGTNFYEMTGALNPSQKNHHLSSVVNEFFSSYMKNDASEVDISISNLNSPKWLQKALKGLSFKSEMPGVGESYDLMSDLRMSRMDVKFSKTGNSVLIRANIKSRVNLPSNFNIGLGISQINAMRFSIEDSKDFSLGSVNVDIPQPCVYKNNSNFMLNMTRDFEMQIKTPGQVQAMQDFISALVLSQGDVGLKLNGVVDPEVRTDHMGIMSLSSIPLHHVEFNVSGMSSFNATPIVISKMDIISGNQTTLVLSISIILKNPSVVETSLGELSLGIFFKSILIGHVEFKDFVAKCCNVSSNLNGVVYFSPTNDVIAREFLSNFVSGSGTGQGIVLHGSSGSSAISLLKPTLSTFVTTSVVPPLAKVFPETPKLVLESKMYAPSFWHLNVIPTTLKLVNPFAVGISILSSDFLLYPCKVLNRNLCEEYYSDPLARFNPKNFSEIHIPSGSKECYQCCEGNDCKKSSEEFPLCPEAVIGSCMAANVLQIISAEVIAALWRTLASSTGLLMRVNGTISVKIGGDYETTLAYQQKDLRVSLSR